MSIDVGEGQTSLDGMRQAREAMLARREAPWWMDVTIAALAGIAFGAAISWRPVGLGIAIVCVIAMLGFEIFAHQHYHVPVIRDGRAFVVDLLANLVFISAMTLTGQCYQGTTDLLTRGVIGAGLGLLALLRVTVTRRYHYKRIATSDYEPGAR